MTLRWTMGVQARSAALGILGFAVFLVLWQSVLWLGLASDRFLAFPSTFVAFLSSSPPLHAFGVALAASAWQFGVGFAIGAGSGVALGLILGWYRRLGAWLAPLLAAINAVPLIAIIPLLVVFLGLTAATELTIVAVFAFFPVFFAVSAAAMAVDPELVRMARLFGGRDRQVLVGIVLPATVPAVVSGLRLGVGRALTGMVTVEIFLGRGGVGTFILDATAHNLPNLALIAVVTLGVANLGISGALRLIQHRVEPWRPAIGVR